VKGNFKKQNKLKYYFGTLSGWPFPADALPVSREHCPPVNSSISHAQCMSNFQAKMKNPTPSSSNCM
jgi:hypothetical protein